MWLDYPENKPTQAGYYMTHYYNPSNNPKGFYYKAVWYQLEPKDPSVYLRLLEEQLGECENPLPDHECVFAKKMSISERKQRARRAHEMHLRMYCHDWCAWNPAMQPPTVFAYLPESRNDYYMPCMMWGEDQPELFSEGNGLEKYGNV